MKDHHVKTNMTVFHPKHMTITRIFDVDGVSIPLPSNRVQYTAVESCTILTEIKIDKRTSISKVIAAMLNYRVLHGGNITSLIPIKESYMFRMLLKFNKDPDVKLKMSGVKPILDHNQFYNELIILKKDDRAVKKNKS